MNSLEKPAGVGKPVSPGSTSYRDTDLATRFLLGMTAVLVGVLAAFLAVTFEFKIYVGLLFGLSFSVLIFLRPYIGLLFLLFTTPVLKIFPATFFGSGLLNPPNLILAWMTLVILLDRILIRRVGISRRAFVPAIAGFGFVLVYSLILTVINGYGTLQTVGPNFRLYIHGLYVYFLAANLIDSDEQARWVFWVAIATIALTGFWGIVEYRSALLGGQSVARIRISGRVGQPNEFGAFLAMYMPFMIAMVRVKLVPRMARLLLVGGVVFCFFALLFTQSRGAYLGLLGTLFFVAFLINRRLLIVLALATVTAPLWLPAQVTERMNETFAEGEGLDGSSETRLDLYKAGVSLWMESPLWGHGFGAFNKLVYRRGYADSERASHSLYIQILSEAGAVGIGILLWLFIHLFRRALWLWRRTHDPFLKAFGEGYIGCMVALVIVNLFGVRFYNYIAISYFWAITACLVWYTERMLAEDRARRVAELARRSSSTRGVVA